MTISFLSTPCVCGGERWKRLSPMIPRIHNIQFYYVDARILNNRRSDRKRVDAGGGRGGCQKKKKKEFCHEIAGFTVGHRRKRNATVQLLQF